MHAQHVAAREQLLEGHGLGAALGERGGVRDGIARDRVHAEWLRAARDLLPHPAQSEEAERPAAQSPQWQPGVVVPPARMHVAVEDHDLPRERQDQRPGVVGKLVDAVARGVRDEDASRRRGGHVDLIQADAVLADHPAAREPGDRGCIAAEVVDEQCVGVLARREGALVIVPAHGDDARPDRLQHGALGSSEGKLVPTTAAVKRISRACPVRAPR